MSVLSELVGTKEGFKREDLVEFINNYIEKDVDPVAIDLLLNVKTLLFGGDKNYVEDNVLEDFLFIVAIFEGEIVQLRTLTKILFKINK